ncbi:S-layer homology domain-containing protein [Arthrobacter oryzae]|uniref:S-layer homology domain-containing protein n=1 Tax=Arthrobacter oryzae TaxID=409290 RepID=UPI00278A054A|nr:S-layer homology domain-containing protein [Arthrobacter oryzae]MDQ0078511.1 hypothetical protein [Arthrobacter oryzae]
MARKATSWIFFFDPVIFHDVNAGSAFHQEISWLALKGITEGWTEADGTRTFRPAQQVNRDQMAAFLYRLADSPDFDPPAESPFVDVPTNHRFYREISWVECKDQPGLEGNG